MFSFIFFAIPETIIFEMSLLSSRLSLPTAGLLIQAPRARSGAPHFLARSTQTLSGSPRFSLCLGAPGLAAGQSANQTRPTVRFGDPHFHARTPRARSIRSRIFTLELDPEPPIFFLTLPPAAHVYLPKYGVSTPPPPPRPATFSPSLRGNHSLHPIIVKTPPLRTCVCHCVYILVDKTKQVSKCSELNVLHIVLFVFRYDAPYLRFGEEIQ